MSYQAESRLPIFCVDKIFPHYACSNIELKLGRGSEDMQ
jgi:hypothetical protein